MQAGEVQEVSGLYRACPEQGRRLVLAALRAMANIGKECPYYFVKHPDAWEGLLNSLTYDNAF